MRFTSTIAVLAALSATAFASPIAQNGFDELAPGDIPDDTPDTGDTSINDCEVSSFNNETDENSPLVSDCLTLASNIAGGGTWMNGKWTNWPTFGTCAFQAGSVHHIKVGNQDIIDLIHSSIDMFASSDGRVGASGSVDCQNMLWPQTDTTGWSIYTTGTGFQIPQ